MSKEAFLTVFPPAQCAGIRHGYSTRHGGHSETPYASLNLGDHVGDDPFAVRLNRKTFSDDVGVSGDRWVTAEQVHGGEVARVSAADAGTKVRGVDALVTDVPDLPLALMFADCLSLFFIDPERRAIGLAHAGWRGTVAEIGLRTVETMRVQFGSRPESIRAAFGPSIGPCCYQVGEEVALHLSPWEETIHIKDGRPFADLQRANRAQLLEAGIQEENLFSNSPCTACCTDRFFSYRREGTTGRMGALLMIEP